MAETLGSLVDKLTIKDLRENSLKEMLKLKSGKLSRLQLNKKLKLLQSQKKDMVKEINDFIISAAKGGIRIKDEKIKLYNASKNIGRIPKLESIGEAISCLGRKNSELWRLEDEARRTDVSDAFIGRVKRKIDLANQQRNDLIDRLDELLMKCLKKNAS